jgi:hypothetical protein
MDNIPPQPNGRPERKKVKKTNSYILFRPYISRLFTYLVLLYLASNNYGLFEEHRETYIDFLNLLDEPLIVDIQLVPHSQSCPSGYSTTAEYFFPGSWDGCICDGYIFKSTQCKYANVKTKNKCVASYMSFPDSATERKSSSQFKGPRNLDEIQAPTNENGDAPNMGSVDSIDCLLCYQDVPHLQEDHIMLNKFYTDKKVCFKYDYEQTTNTYLKSVSQYCDEKNICNEFFCKLNNDENKKCPITTLLDKKYINTWADPNFSKPFGFSDTYKDFFNYDSNYHGYVFAPIINISIGRSGACDDEDSVIKSNYPLVKNNQCQEGSRYSNFDSVYLSEILISNGLRSEIENSLPYFFNYTTKEKWNIVSKTAFAKDTLYCMINKFLLFSENSFTIMSKGKLQVTNKEEMRPGFSEKLYVFYNIKENADFQERIQGFILSIYIIMTILEVSYVLIKLFNVCGDSVKCLLCICGYEGYLAFVVDIIIMITSAVSNSTLSKFVHHVEELIESGCLDELVKGKMELFKVATDVMADKNMEMFLIILMKFVLIFISLLYTVISKGGKINFRQCEQIIFEKEEDEEEEEKEEEKRKKTKPRSTKQLNYVNIEQDASKLSQRRLNDPSSMDQTSRSNNTYLEVTKRIDATVNEPDKSENLGPGVNVELQLRQENNKPDQP